MEKEKLKILVIDTHSNQTLMECSLEEAEKAHQFAAEMEELGLEVSIKSPTLTETLSASLGLSPEAVTDYQDSVQQELEDHDGSCCFCEDDDSTIH